MSIEGEPRNAGDGILNGARDARRRPALIVPVTRGDLEPGTLAARFDIALGLNLFP